METKEFQFKGLTLSGFAMLFLNILLTVLSAVMVGSPDKPGGLSIQLCKSEKKEFYIRYSS